MDIVIFGGVLSWDTMEGQRGRQLAREFLEMGHRVLFVEADPSRNQQSYNTKGFRVVNILPRHWPLYDMEPRTLESKTPGIIGRATRYADEKGNTWSGRRLLSLVPSRLRRGLVSRRMGHEVPLDDDLPIIRERLSSALDGFCVSGSNRLVVFEAPMRCYVECLDIFKERNFRIVYELIDKWELMWRGQKIRRLDDERRLVAEASLVTASSKDLVSELTSRYPSRTVSYLPNAVKRDLFDINRASGLPTDMPKKRDVTVGYFGSICEWFDFETVAFLADQRPQWNIVIIGEHPLRAEFPLDEWEMVTSRANVYALGKKKQSELINYLAQWDVCMIPFCDTPLTRATSPVKVYEYLSAYKPVVTFEFEETQGFPYVYQAKNKEDFLNKTEIALTNPIDHKLVDDFLAENTWRNRAQSILNFMNSG
jgi:hypothetical protein